MLDKVRERRSEIYALAQRHNAEWLWVFGSCARREERPDSDIDFLVKFSGPVGFDVMWRILSADLPALLPTLERLAAALPPPPPPPKNLMSFL